MANYRVVQSGSKVNPILRLVDPREYVRVIPQDKCHGSDVPVIVREKSERAS